MSRVSIKRFKNAKVYPNAKSDVVTFVTDELANIAQEIDSGFKNIKFEENFSGAVVSVQMEAFRQTVIGNPIGITPNGYLVIDGNLPLVTQGTIWNRDQVSFLSHYGAHLTFNGAQQNVSVSTGSDYFTLEGAVYHYTPVFREPMKIVFRDSSSGTLPTGLTFGQEYWIKDIANRPFEFGFSLEKGGALVNITGTGSGTVDMAATGALRILLLK